MIVQIKVRDDRGRYVEPCASEFASAALRQIYRISSEAWPWLRDSLCRFCLRQAEDNQRNHGQADLWIQRYQKLREIG